MTIRKESFADNFSEAKKVIKGYFDLDLTLIEQVELKKIIELTTMVDDRDREIFSKEYDKYTITPFLEAAYIFMNRNYSAGINDYGDLYKLEHGRLKNLKSTGFDNYLFNFKEMQEEMHFP